MKAQHMHMELEFGNETICTDLPTRPSKVRMRTIYYQVVTPDPINSVHTSSKTLPEQEIQNLQNTLSQGIAISAKVYLNENRSNEFGGDNSHAHYCTTLKASLDYHHTRLFP